MAKRIGATVALIVIAVMVAGSMFMLTPMGQKATHFVGDVKSQGMSSDGMLDCITSSCGTSGVTMSGLFG